MKKNLLTAIFLLVFSYSFSQNITADTTLANEYFDLAKKNLGSQKFDSTNFYLDKAQPLYVMHLGEHSLKNANVLHVKGVLNYNKAKYDLALEYNFKALQIRKDILGEKNNDIAFSYQNIGNVYISKSEYDKALEYQFKSLQIRKELLGEKHIDVAANYNNIGIIYYYKNLFDLALEFQIKGLLIRKELLGEKSILVATSYNNIGNSYYVKNEYNVAIDYYTKAMIIRKAVYGEKHVLVAESYEILGIIFYLKNDFKLALEYLFKSLKIKKEILGEKHNKVAATYDNIGNVFYLKYECDLAMEYYFKALQIRQKIFDEKNIDIGTSYFNIGNAYYAKKEFALSLEYYLKSMEIYKQLFGEKHTLVVKSYHTIGSIYFENSKYEEALEYFFKSLTIQKELLGEKNTDVAVSYWSIGNTYFFKSEYSKALEYFFKSLLIRKELLGEKHSDLTMSNTSIANVYKQKKNSTLALKFYQKAIASCLRNFNDTINVNTVPTIVNYLDWNQLLIAIRDKAQLFATTNLEPRRDLSLQLALRHYQACDTLIDLTRKEISKLSDKISLGETASQIYEDAIDVSEKLKVMSEKQEDKRKYTETAFYFSEKNKSSVLLEALAGQEAQKFAGIPDSLLEKEHNLKTDIAFYTKQLAQPENLDSVQEIRYRGNLFNNNRSYDSLIQLFENNYPKYHELKYNQKTVTVGDIQSLLDKHTAMISYTVGDSLITVFTITNKSLDVQQITKPANFADTIQLLRKSLTTSGKKSEANYKRIASNVYELLFPRNIDRRIKNLIIVPDNVLATIPFEALLTTNQKSEGFKSLPYLIRKYNVSYSYSATLFKRTFPKEKNTKIEVTPLNDWLAFAPVFSDKNSKGITIASRELVRQFDKMSANNVLTRGAFLLNGNYIPPLPATETEVNSIFKQFDASKYKAKVELQDNATEAVAKSDEPKNYKIIHFATHGFVNSEKPELSGLLLAQVADTTSKDLLGGENLNEAQNDGILYSGEIYNLKLNADLVVLSACETGLGKIKKGEGIIGLTRALLYAGTKNIVVSLWRVADESTSDLMIDFYKNILHNGLQKPDYSASLRKAKLKMLKDETFAHPYYWSPFILVGK